MLALPLRDTPASLAATSSEGRLRAIYEAHGESLLRFLTKRNLGDVERAKDLLQETFLRAWRHVDDLPDEPGLLRAWLFTVARHVTIDAGRASRIRPAEVGVPDLRAFASGEDPAEQVTAVYTVRAALARLSPAHREILVELFFHDRTPRELAERLGIPAGTVKSRTYYAMQALAAAVEAD
ncbi:sigma-70 family RNA polymerase sigma factor [Phytohabitans flavus]|nr:sigma-70 family RNA polymerase sigma factor [Phytohabitans flavus]